MIRFLVLAGYFELTIYLHLSGKLNQYINMHYSYLAYISMVLSFILAIVQLYIWMKQVKTHSHLNSRLAKMTSISLLAIPLVIGLTFPTVSLDSQTVSAKGYHFPLSEGTDLAIQTSEGTTSQYLKPDTSSYFSKSAYEKEMRTAADKYLSQDSIQITNENYMEVMEAIYDYPDEFEGKTIQFTGFVYNDPSHANSQFLFRFGIIHCIADSGVYGLLTKGNTRQYENNTWISAKGKLLFILDFCILMLILLIFKDLRLVSYTLLFDFIVSRVIDLIGEGGYAGKGFMIITKRPDQLAKAINDDLGRGVTFISGQGYYSKENLKIIYCIVGRNEIVKTKEMIHRIDPQAFITITEAHEILGEGFTFEKE
ncbi:ABC transporter substrate-binding protein [Streptococcus pneumoniae]|nr:ABC transporter substrate-binding protein [Streptococcus pneumoniae]